MIARLVIDYREIARLWQHGITPAKMDPGELGKLQGSPVLQPPALPYSPSSAQRLTTSL